MNQNKRSSALELFLDAAFELAKLDFTEYMIAIGLAFCTIPVVEIVKLVCAKLSHKKTEEV